MATWGRQYPDGPLEPPPGWFSDENLRKRASVAADVSGWAAGAFGEVMRALLNPEPEPGPPYVHTLAPPQQPVFSRSGKLVYRPPSHPAYTLRSPAPAC